MKHITLSPLSKENVKLAGQIQYKIFPHSASYSKYLEELEDDNCEYRDFIITLGTIPIGIIGYYLDSYEKDTAWLSWFGLLNENRHKGFGRDSLNLLCDILKNKGFKRLRLFTYEVWNKEAQPFYQKYMDFEEYYTNENDNQYDIINGKCKIFTKNLSKEKSALWNNKFINIGEEDTLNEQSIIKMKMDKII